MLISKMSQVRRWTLYHGTWQLILLYILSSATCESLTPRPFSLTVSPEIVIRDVTKDIRVYCGYDGKTASQIQEISKVVLFKKTGENWIQLTESRWYNTPLKDAGMEVSYDQRRLLKFKSELANQNVFGIYRCDVIGFDKWATSVTESSPEVELINRDLTSFLIETNSLQQRQIESLKEEIASLKASSNGELKTVKEHVYWLTMKLKHLSTELVSGIKDQISLADEVRQNISTLRENITDDKTSLETYLNGQRHDIVSIRGNYLSLKNEISVAKDDIRYNTVNISALNDHINSITTSVENRFSSFETEVLDNVTGVLAAEKKTVSAVREQLGDINVHLSRLNHSFDAMDIGILSLKGDYGRTKSQVVGLVGNLQSVKESMTTLSGHVKAINRNISNVDMDVVDMKTNVSSLGINVNAIQEQVLRLSGNMSAVKTNVSRLHEDARIAEGKVMTYQTDLNNVYANMSAFTKDVNNLNKQMTSVEEKVKVSAGIVSLFRGDLNAMTRNVSSLRWSVNTAQVTSTALVQNISTLQGNLSSLTGDVNTVKRDIRTLGTDVDSVKAKTSNLDGQLNATKKQMSSLYGDVNSLKTERAAFTKEMTSLKTKVSAASYDVRNVQDKAVSTAREIASLKNKVSLLTNKSGTSLNRKQTSPNSKISGNRHRPEAVTQRSLVSSFFI
ncbi:hypothetical protein EGW08_004636 [Elysia chlorotica]|uniref:Uncharacterized protein n=1 Tax=Elysia chlorotica TaxID=188477 RepID=A0A433U175_ELYCH|nr:hypothetical protein EGW08_004636 [Elysia chlorotica]